MIEDVITTGGQVVLSAQGLREFGAKVEHVVCVIERDQKGRENLKQQKLILHSLFTMEQLEKASK